MISAAVNATAPAFTPGASAPAGFDPTDVPGADPAHLLGLLAALIRNGDGLVMLREDAAEAIRAVEDEFWAEFTGETAAGVAAVIRFRALIEVFAARRLRSLLLREGYAVLQAAFQVAAHLRLNPERGFNPQGLVWAVTAHAVGPAEGGLASSKTGHPKREQESAPRATNAAAGQMAA